MNDKEAYVSKLLTERHLSQRSEIVYFISCFVSGRSYTGVTFTFLQTMPRVNSIQSQSTQLKIIYKLNDVIRVCSEQASYYL